MSRVFISISCSLVSELGSYSVASASISYTNEHLAVCVCVYIYIYIYIYILCTYTNFDWFMLLNIFHIIMTQRLNAVLRCCQIGVTMNKCMMGGS